MPGQELLYVECIHIESQTLIFSERKFRGSRRSIHITKRGSFAIDEALFLSKHCGYVPAYNIAQQDQDCPALEDGNLAN